MEDASKHNIEQSQNASRIGHQEWRGPDVAMLNPLQQMAMQNTAQAGGAFGLAPDNFNTMAYQPQAQEFAGGVWGHSGAPIFDAAKAEWEQMNPERAQMYNSMFGPEGGQQQQQQQQQHPLLAIPGLLNSF